MFVSCSGFHFLWVVDFPLFEPHENDPSEFCVRKWKHEVREEENMQINNVLVTALNSVSFLKWYGFSLFLVMVHGKQILLCIGKLQACHHPFTAPHPDDRSLVFSGKVSDVMEARAQHFDLVVNGIELGGGSVRLHDPEQQNFVLHSILKVCPVINYIVIVTSYYYCYYYIPWYFSI